MVISLGSEKLLWRKKKPSWRAEETAEAGEEPRRAAQEHNEQWRNGILWAGMEGGAWAACLLKNNNNDDGVNEDSMNNNNVGVWGRYLKR